MSPIVAILVVASACAVKAGVLPLVTYGQTLSGHSIDHSLAAQLIPAAPLVAAPAPVVAPAPLVAPAPVVGPAPLYAAHAAPLVAHASPYFAAAKVASPLFGSYFPF